MDQTEHEPRESRSPEPRDTGHESRAANRCRHCVYARRPTGRWLRLILSRWPGLLICTNHPDAPGDILGVPACSTCSNFRAKPAPIDRPEVTDPVGPAVCQIPLTQGKIAIVDRQDYERVSRYKWCLSRVGHQLYAHRRQYGKTIRLHQFIMNPPKGKVVDHANGNGLDNRRENLRICTMLENAWNKRRRKPPGAHSRFIGVYPCQRPPGKWCVKVQCKGKVTNLGSFDDEVESARARDRKAVELFGDYATLNFPAERDQRLLEIEAERRSRGIDSRRDAQTQR
jgi:hypothetical protein